MLLRWLSHRLLPLSRRMDTAWLSLVRLPKPTCTLFDIVIVASPVMMTGRLIWLGEVTTKSPLTTVAAIEERQAKKQNAIQNAI
ncbi:MAG: hypothetical protein ACOX9C_06950 [Kiritimatiellia bacterium]